MTIDIAFLRTRVARRIFMLFILCALVPISALTVLSYVQVSGQLKKQSMDRLQNAVKAHGMSVYERFLFLEAHLNMVASAVQSGAVDQQRIESVLGSHGSRGVDAIVRIDSDGSRHNVYGQLDTLPETLETIMDSADSGRTRILFAPRHPDLSGEPAQVFMVMTPEHDLQTPGFLLVGRIDPAYLWGIGHANMLPPMTDLCIVDQFRKVLVTSFEMSDTLLHRLAAQNNQTNAGHFQYEWSDQNYVVSYWSIFMKSGFEAANITVVLRRSTADVLSPLNQFKRIFPLVALLSFWIVSLLSVYHIRKSLVPLEALKKGTMQVAQNNFKSRVLVDSHDEFEDLAASFNEMSRSLDRNFEALTTRSEIDRAILSSLNVKEVISTALRRMYTYFSCDTIGISLAVDQKPSTYHAYVSRDISIRKIQEFFFEMAAADEQALFEHQTHMLLDLSETRPCCTASAVTDGMQLALVLPVFINDMLKGTIALGFTSEKRLLNDDLAQARQIADQVAVALSNARLVAQLEKLNLGTLEALARTVDAKSAWTAGHSERVTHLSVKTARVLGLSDSQVETLRRAAYLHDIGKIGIPLAILDKPGRLTNEEFEMIKEHPVIGARILEPIEAYADVLSMIYQHHEKYDGNGYPDGLAGEEITLGARIMAVADVYDAVVSDRPYRQGWIEEKAIDMITRESGTHFDPRVVDAFLVAVSQ